MRKTAKAKTVLSFKRWRASTILAMCLGCCLVLTEFSFAQTPSELFKLPQGFQAELVYDVPNGQGSWVSMTTDPKGRLICSDQYGALYRVTVTGDQPVVESIDIQLGFAQGLLCAFDSLYVMSSGNNGRNGTAKCEPGLYRVRDTNGDDKYDSFELLRKIVGRGEHGPHAIVLSPDKKSIHVCGGNMAQLPELASSRQKPVWKEDQIIKRYPDPRGHANGLRAPGGWICKTDPEGKSFELISSGFRNEYDFAFDPNGEMFTYDADMEWDFGLPWYRPTRVCHAVSGAEFGWRMGSGKWPSYYPDSVPSVIDIGPGSPTGVVFGTGAKFPAKYQHAFFISDWSYGIIYAIHLQPNGATYRAEKEIFCTAPALPVTDIVINGAGDGAMYFLIGGRRSHSSLYRVKYAGEQSTASAPYPPLTPAAKQRRQIEAAHVANSEVGLDELLKALDSNDRAIRYAARIGIERQPVDTWAEQLKNGSTQMKLELATALVRVGTAEHQTMVAGTMGELDFAKLDSDQKYHLLRNLGLVLARMGEPNETTRKAIAKLEQQLPSKDPFLNFELGKLLVAAKSPMATKKLVKLLSESDSQESKISYALTLSSATEGWDTESRKAYFQWFLDNANARGGNSFDGYLRNMRQHSITQLSAEENEALKELLAKKPTPVDPYAELKARPFVKEWKLKDFMPISDNEFEGRDLANGKKMFAVATCYKCHRIKGNGGVVGPDLTAAGRRFSTKDMLETIIDPSKAISDQYEAHVFQMVDGRLITGRVVNLAGDSYRVQPDMADPNRLVGVKVGDIEEMQPSPVSPMPANLLDHLTKDEILDLLAYMKSTVEVGEE